MAKITITIEDTPDKTVKVKFTPDLRSIAALEHSESFTAAHNFALATGLFLADFTKRVKVLMRGIVLPPGVGLH